MLLALQLWQLGLTQELEQDSKLVKHLLAVMKTSGADFSITFRSLSQVHIPTSSTSEEEAKLAAEDSDVEDPLPPYLERFLDELLETLPTPKQLALRVRPKIPAHQLKSMVCPIESSYLLQYASTQI